MILVMQMRLPVLHKKQRPVLFIASVFVAAILSGSLLSAYNDDSLSWQTQVFVRQYNNIDSAEQERRRSLVDRYGASVRDIVIELSNKYLISVINKNPDKHAIALAVEVAGLYGPAIGGGLVDNIRRMENYSSSEAISYFQAQQHLTDGFRNFHNKKLSLAEQEWRQAHGIFLELKCETGLTSSHYNLAIVELAKNHMLRARENLDAAISLASRTGDIDIQYRAMNQKATVLYLASEYGQAVKIYLENLKIAEHYKTRKEVLDTRIKLVLSYIHLGGEQDGLKENIKILQSTMPDDELQQASIWLEIGAAYAKTKRPLLAVEYYKKAMVIYRATNDLAAVAILSRDIAFNYFNATDYTNAIRWYEEVVENKDHIQQELLASSLINLAASHYYLGSYADALKSYEQANSLYQGMGDDKGVALAKYGIGLINIRLGKDETAISYLMESINADVKSKDYSGVSQGYILVGNILRESGNLKTADMLYQRAYKIALQEKDENLQGMALSSLASINLDRRDYADAIRQYTDSLRLLRNKKEYAHSRVSILLNLAKAYRDTEQYKESEKSYERALQLARQHQINSLLWNVYASLADFYGLTKQDELSYKNYKKALERANEYYAENSELDEETKNNILNAIRRLSEFMVQKYIRIHKKDYIDKLQTELYETIQYAKSRLAGEYLAMTYVAGLMRNSDKFDSLYRRLVQNKNELAQLRWKAGLEPEGPYTGKINIKLAEIRSLQGQIAKEFPEYAQKKIDPVVSLAEIQSQLRPHEVILDYYLMDSQALVFIIRHEQVKTYHLNVGRAFVGVRVQEFNNGLRNIARINDLEKFDPGFGYTLYYALFRPIEKYLSAGDHLFVVADGPLSSLPFEALVSKPFDRGRFLAIRKQGASTSQAYLAEYDDIKYLLQSDYTFTYLPSSSSFYFLRATRKQSTDHFTKNLVAFADPDYKQSKCDCELNRLEKSRDEAMAIANLVGADKKDIYLGKDASEENLYQAGLENAKYILLSTHGFIGHEYKSLTEPTLILTRTGDSPEKDGLFTLSEVLGLKLHARTVVLSACKTTGKQAGLLDAESFSGFSRSFLHAGAQSLIVSHWSVDQDATREILVDTFKNMKTAGIAKALQQSKQTVFKSSVVMPNIENIRMSRSHPYFWAGLVMIGQ